MDTKALFWHQKNVSVHDIANYLKKFKIDGNEYFNLFFDKDNDIIYLFEINTNFCAASFNSSHGRRYTIYRSYNTYFEVILSSNCSQEWFDNLPVDGQELLLYHTYLWT